MLVRINHPWFPQFPSKKVYFFKIIHRTLREISSKSMRNIHKNFVTVFEKLPNISNSSKLENPRFS